MASCAVYCTAVLCVTMLQKHCCSLSTAVAMCLLCCIALLISGCKSKSKFQPNAGPLACKMSVSFQITSGYCPKTWEVSNSLTKTTAGNFCAGQKYSSMYSCAANCRYSSSQLEQAQCAGLPDKLSYTSGEQAVAICRILMSEVALSHTFD